MKRYILTLLLAACVCTACDKDDEYEIREWTVASQLGIAHGASTLQPVLLVKANDDTSWRAVYQGIEGFDFEAGYEYRLRIKAEQLPDPPQDGSSIRYTLLEQISKTPGDLGHPRPVLPGLHDGGRPAADELPGTAIPGRTVPRVRTERMAAVAVPHRRVRIRTGIRLPAPHRDFGNPGSGQPRGLLHRLLLDARHGQAACRGLKCGETS